MATSHSLASSTSLPSSLPCRPRRFSSKPTRLISCVTSSFPSKPTRRNNYLRRKILKQPLIPNPSLIPIDSPPPPPPLVEEFNESSTELLEFDKSAAENEEEELGTVQVEVSVPAGNAIDGSVFGVLDKKSIWKYVLWLIGAFVFQTVCAVWVFSSGSQDEVLAGNEESSGTEEVGGDEKENSRLVRVVLKGKENGKMGVENGGADESVVYIDEVEMERKIEEIRVLAREAREKEKLELKKGGFESEDEEEKSVEKKDFKSGIEEEVDSRLIKLRKKLETALPLSGCQLKDNVEKDEEDNGALLFKKKYKFKGLPVDLMEKPKPKGFTGLNGDGDGQFDVDSMRSDDGIHVEDGSLDKDESKMSESMNGSWRHVVKEQGMKKQGNGKGAPKPKVVNGMSFWNLWLLE